VAFRPCLTTGLALAIILLLYAGYDVNQYVGVIIFPKKKCSELIYLAARRLTHMP
jgi:hypothetical protein